MYSTFQKLREYLKGLKANISELPMLFIESEGRMQWLNLSRKKNEAMTQGPPTNPTMIL